MGVAYLHSDMWVYNIPSDTTTMIADGKTTQSKQNYLLQEEPTILMYNIHVCIFLLAPVSGFTVRATLEPKRSEIYLHLVIIVAS